MEESKTAARPLPCRNCLKYHKYHVGKICKNEASCYKCGGSHPSYTCKTIPTKDYCGTCRKKGHRTAASNCPLRPKQGKLITSKKIFRHSNSTNTYADILKLKENQTSTTNNVQSDTQKLEDYIQEKINKCMGVIV